MESNRSGVATLRGMLARVPWGLTPVVYRAGVTFLVLMVDGWCAGCHKPLGFKVAWHSADFAWHKKCWKAREVYTPPPAFRRSGSN